MLIEHIQEFLESDQESLKRKAILKFLLLIFVLCIMPYVSFFFINQEHSFFQPIVLSLYGIWAIRLRIDRAHFLSFAFLYRGIGFALPVLLWLYALAYLFRFTLPYCGLAVLLILIIFLVIWLSAFFCRRHILMLACNSAKKNDQGSIVGFATAGGALGVTVAGPLLFQNISQDALFLVVCVIGVLIHLVFLFCAGISWYKFYLFCSYRSQLDFN